MKILLGVPEYPPFHIGGGGEVFFQLATGYQKAGHRVVVVYGYYLSSGWNERIVCYEKEGITFYQVPEIPYPKNMPFLRTTLPCTLRVLRELKGILQKERCDIAHLHGFGLLFINQLAFLLRKLHVPYVLTLHGAPVTPQKTGGMLHVAYRFYCATVGKKLLEKSTAITAVSRFTTEIQEFASFKNNIMVVGNGIDMKKYIFSPGGERILPYDGIKFLSLGRIEWIKGYHLFLPVLQKLKEAGFHVKYFIAGSDNGFLEKLKDRIQQYHLEHDVVFLGYLDFERKVQALHETDFVVVSSLHENCPAVPLEAIACKKVAICNNTGGIPEIIIHKQNGILVDMNHAHETYMTVREILEGKILIPMERISLQEYTWETKVGEYLRIFESIVGKH